MLIQWAEEHLVLLLCGLGILVWIDWVLIYLFWTGKIKQSRIPSPLFSWDAWKTELIQECTNFKIIVSAIIAPVRPILLGICILGFIGGAIVTCAFVLATGFWIIMIVPTKIWLVGYIINM